MLKQKVVKLACASLLATSIWGSFGVQASHASASHDLQTKSIYMNDLKRSYQIQLQNGFQLVPASLFRELGMSVNWNNAERAVIISSKQHSVKLPINTRQAYYKEQNKQWTKQPTLTTQTVLINNQSYVPLAYVAKTLGLAVTYNEQLKAAVVQSVVSNSVNIQNSPSVAVPIPNSSSSQKYELTADELYWLYRIAEAEAGGESFEGKQAVAATVLNRTQTEGWPNNAVDVIFEIVEVNGKQYYQFEPVLNEYIYKVTPSEDTKKAVDAAIRGEDPTNGAVVFYNPAKTSNKWILSRPIIKQIGNHVFAK